MLRNKIDTNKILKELGATARSFFINSFRMQGWNNNSFTHWQEVQRRIAGTNAYKYIKPKTKRKSAILVLSGALRRSVAGMLVKINEKNVTIELPDSSAGGLVSYARYHNEGTKNIPKRKFMGESNELKKQLKQVIKRNINFVITNKK